MLQRSMRTNSPQLKPKAIILAAILALIALAITACGEAPGRQWVNAPGWSRALLVGNTASGDPAPIALDPNGRLFILLFEPGEPERAMVVGLDADGVERWRSELDLSIGRGRRPTLVWTEATLYALFLDDETLLQARLNPESGEVQSQPVAMEGAIPVDSFAAVADGNGLRLWVAGSRRQPGLYVTDQDNSAWQVLDGAGIKPQVIQQPSGSQHLIWAHHPLGFGGVEFLYGRIDPSGPGLLNRMVLIEPAVGPTAVLQGPKAASDGVRGYLAWSVIARTGLSAGSSTSRYMSFDLADPEPVGDGVVMQLPNDYHLPYQSLSDGIFAAGDRVSLPVSGAGTSNYIADVELIGGAGEVAAVVSTRAEYLRNKNERQTAVVYFADGSPVSYQLVSFSPAGSTSPAIASNEQWLYMSWLEKGDQPGFLVYLSSTDPNFTESLEQITQDDAGRVTADILFGMLTGLVLAPLAAVAWSVAPLILLALTSFIRGENESLASPGTFAGLALAMVAFWVGKLTILPEIGVYVPFSAWVPFLPAWLEPILQYGSPVFSAILGLVVAWALTYRRQSRSPIYFFLIYAAVDGLLTGALYGVLFYAAF